GNTDALFHGSWLLLSTANISPSLLVVVWSPMGFSLLLYRGLLFLALSYHNEHVLYRCLSWRDLTWFGFGSVIGASIFVMSRERRRQPSPLPLLSKPSRLPSHSTSPPCCRGPQGHIAI
ncbi:hypothetical protein B296_00051344, partial [Ensete ventricosum]